MDLAIKIIAAVAGSLLTAYYVHRRLKQAEKDRLELAGHKAFIEGKLEAERAEEEVDNVIKGIQDSKDTPVDVTDW